MNELSKRIIEALESTGKKDAQLSREIGISKSAFTQWRNGDIRGLKAETAAKLEKATGYSAVWLATGKGAKKTHEQNATHVANISSRRYPLISYVQAGNWCEASDPFQPGDADTWLPCLHDLGDNGFALRVRGESMTNPSGVPSFPDGIIIFIKPNTDYQAGDFVVAKRETENEATFKQFKIIDGEPYLFAINPNWPHPYIKLKEGDRICGKVEFAGFSLT